MQNGIWKFSYIFKITVSMYDNSYLVTYDLTQSEECIWHLKIYMFKITAYDKKFAWDSLLKWIASLFCVVLPQ